MWVLLEPNSLSMDVICVCPPKISDSDKDVINTKLDEVTGWLDANQQQAEADKFREMLREAEAICNPIVTKLYQDARKVCSRKCSQGPISALFA